LNTATDVPFTTRGTDAISWAEDVNHLVLMDADMLRQELALPDGAWLVGLGDLTLGEILAQKIFIIVITGQSNAV
ncbi:hypothetical protein JAF86_004874, partial [Citrobacter braakii]|nr:hypothetical protein [Citrobacter braakii]